MGPEYPNPNSQTTTDTPLLAGRYQLLDKLGEGGMGTVFRARDITLNRFVAIKILPAGKLQDADAVARFRREALALAKLSHANIIQAYDSGQDGDKHFLVMELVEGRSLAMELADKGRLAPTRAADYGHQAALALQHAHRLGLVHRDVKPSNLLVDAEGRVRLLDLGLARFLQDQIGDSTLTQEGSGMGTPDYCSPEQFRDAHKADARSDIYSLGCTLYHLMTGKPPFPGSSLSEKVKAHETREAPPVEEACPDVPGGLALTLTRMMAKRPADRFANMAEVAEALSPYVAGASALFRHIRNTATWTGSQLETMPAYPRRRAMAWLIAGGTMLLILLTAVGLSYVWLHHGTEQVVARQDDTAPVANSESTTKKETKPPTEESKQLPKGEKPDDPNVLTVSRDAKDGGHFRTLTEAVAAVDRPEMTVRILDAAEYPESVEVRGAVRQGLTLEAPRHATLVQKMPNGYGVSINEVPGVTIRGFKIRLESPLAGVRVGGVCPGVMLEDLEITSPTKNAIGGISLENTPLAAKDRPIIIQDCTVTRCIHGLVVLGNELRTNQAIPSRRVVLRRNRIDSGTVGILLTGQVDDVQVVANRISNCPNGGIRFADLKKGAKSILVANNTIVGRRDCLQLQGRIEAVEDIRICNNHFLADQAPDVSFTGSNPQILASWRFDHNARPVFAETSGYEDASVPPRRDLTRKELGDLKRQPKAETFPRPAEDSPLATRGAGKEDPSLPAYIGALPPEGGEAWDWDRTWRMPKDAQLLTVSKEPSGGGKYRAINDALKEVRPWATVRVLDNVEYNETLSIKDKAKYEGLTLEAPKRATLLMAAKDRYAIQVRGVPHVRVTGIRIRDLDDRFNTNRSCVFVTGDGSGITLTNLEVKANSGAVGILLPQVRADGKPLTVEKCLVDVVNDGMAVIGNPSIGTCREVRLSQNRVRSRQVRGILLSGALEDVQVTGNFVWGCGQAGLQIEDPTVSLRRVLLANNTVCDSLTGFRLVENNAPKKHGADQVELFNNLLFDCREADAGYLLFRGQDGGAGDGRELVTAWNFRGNTRDMSGGDPAIQIPLAAADCRLAEADLVAADSQTPDRIRPTPRSALARGGASGDLPLPRYVGALPPEGSAPWDWDRTWRTRTKSKDK